MKKVEDYVRTIPDFPEKGVMFRDITTVLKDPDGFELAIDELQGFLEGIDFDVIAGTESRGFIFGTPLAYNLHKPFVLIRKRASSRQRPWSRHTISSTAQLLSRCTRIRSHRDRR